MIPPFCCLLSNQKGVKATDDDAAQMNCRSIEYNLASCCGIISQIAGPLALLPISFVVEVWVAARP